MVNGFPAISIHALREEGDGVRDKVADLAVISIHALREEGDSAPPSRKPSNCLFLSTPSARRATTESFSGALANLYFYPRPPRGGRLKNDFGVAGLMGISIHALREEGDIRDGIAWVIIWNFYPRPPRGGRRCSRAVQQAQRKFLSTPSARRATTTMPPFLGSIDNFYPRPPRGGRLCRICRKVSPCQHFYPRPPRGGRRCGRLWR